MAAALTTAAGHATDAVAVLARQTRYRRGGAAAAIDGGALPVDLTASAEYAAVDRTVRRHAGRVMVATRRRPTWKASEGAACRVGVRCGHDSCDDIRWRVPPSPLALAAAWLAHQTEWLRRQPDAARAFDELQMACRRLAQMVDRPAERDLVGMCDCGRVLYAVAGREVVRCPNPCGATWHVDRSRDILRAALDERLVTAGEAARLAQYLDGDRNQDQIRALISRWVRAGILQGRGVAVEADTADDPDSVATFRFGDIRDRLARTPRRGQAA
ncbi:DUF1922 domain-containing protein [Mangrovihabitans endophyticus]|uniref:Uncharacterized protein n=1 Tax=Mangrovihabitans endophyticus TaxID=1751298 RepID=A0A8J3BZL7_9ACTN|nr:DUF1922 domain-containing protein [Mangrovihabitans endophyticus]GGK89330.1 hypothetical protein GCM10012284_24130 [Mangrovihabitans endophyticus]